jgi:hypothetical protein
MEAFHDFLRRNPLYVFSMYTGKQVEIVSELGAKIERLLDEAITASAVDGTLFQQIYGDFWLWVLGAYEIVRTMSQAKVSFTPDTIGRINVYKRKLAALRIPFAKQEFARNGGPIGGEPSVYGIDTARKDFKYEVGGEVYTIRELISGFRTLVASIDASHVLRPLPTLPPQRP